MSDLPKTFQDGWAEVLRKRGTNGVLKEGGRIPKRISLAPIKGASHEAVHED